MVAPTPEPRTYRLTEADIAVPPPHLFLSQRAEMLDDHFGTPNLIRKEGQAEVRQYLTEAPFGTCVVLAILYDGRGLEPRIDHLTVRENGTEAAEPIHCLREVAFAQVNPPQS